MKGLRDRLILRHQIPIPIVNEKFACLTLQKNKNKKTNQKKHPGKNWHNNQ